MKTHSQCGPEIWGAGEGVVNILKKQKKQRKPEIKIPKISPKKSRLTRYQLLPATGVISFVISQASGLQLCNSDNEVLHLKHTGTGKR